MLITLNTALGMKTLLCVFELFLSHHGNWNWFSPGFINDYAAWGRIQSDENSPDTFFAGVKDLLHTGENCLFVRAPLISDDDMGVTQLIPP